jgi:succinate-semialdehyde dehydrogenase / glutarate-semialdehyde dehydrogenase
MKLNNQTLLKTTCYINGSWQEATDGNTIEVTNPATGQVIGQVPNLTNVQVNAAIDAAASAFAPWSNMSSYDRAPLLEKWSQLLLDNLDDLATILTSEQGKPLSEAKAEITHAASYLRWFAEQAKRADGDIIPAPSPHSKLLVIKQAVGVVATITPWNFPISMIVRKVSAALAAGCTVVIKPSELTPLSGAAVIALAEQAGFPAGVINLVTGEPKRIGELFSASVKVKKLSFTGSTAVGKLLMRQCAANVKKISLELGGHAPFIVFSDADIHSAVAGLIASKFRNSGQTCICPNRLYVHSDVYTQFKELLLQQIAKLKLGNGLDESTTQGPLINQQSVAKALQHVQDALAGGATLLCGGTTATEIGDNYFLPTLLENLDDTALILHQETFAPVIPLLKFSDNDNILAQANHPDYGLAAYFYTQNLARTWQVSQGLEYGMVAVNSPQFSSACVPFAGTKQSGFGCEGSKYGIDEYLNLKLVKIDGLG